MRVHLVSVPYRYDERAVGLGAGPDALLREGLAARVAAAGLESVGPIEATLPDEEREPGRTALNIGRLGARTAGLVAAARRDGAGSLVLAGDDTAAIGIVAGVQQADGAGTPIGLVWVDAHGDFNTPETSFSGILAGMPVAILAGLAGPVWRGAAGLAAPIPTDRILLVGTRELDETEGTLLRSTDVRVLAPADVCRVDPLRAVVARLAATCAVICLHIDLDVLDPRHVPSSSTPAERGLEIDEAARAIATVLETGKVATVSVAGLNPGAGARGTRSIESTLALLDQVLPAWTTTPPAPNGA